jgi:hypothetical protein
LARIAQIKPGQEDGFIFDLAVVFSRLPRMIQFDRKVIEREVTSKQLRRVNRAASQLRRELENLDTNARRALGVAALRRQQFGATDLVADLIYQTEDLIAVADGLSRGEKLLLAIGAGLELLDDGASSCLLKAGSHGGAPSKSPEIPGNPKVSSGDLFFLEVFRIVQRHGGRLTIDKNAGSGTCLEFRDYAAPYLPSDIGLAGCSPRRLGQLRALATGHAGS